MARPRISIVNDSPEFLELMSEILGEDAAYEVAVHDGQETSVADLVAARPDLIIVDLRLGAHSGWDIVTLARTDTTLARLPIIICSADIAQLREREAELSRISDVHVLKKPFGIEELLELVDRLLEGDSQPSAASEQRSSV